MSIIDRAISYVSHLFDSTPPAQNSRPQAIPVTPITLSGYGNATPTIAATNPRGSERLFQNPNPAASRPQTPTTSNTGLGASLLGGALIVGGALLSESGIGIGMMVAGFGILGVGCGAPEENPNNFNANIPEASAPVTQDQWCEGIRSLTAAPITDASPLINQFPGISDDLRNLPRDMSAIGIAPQDPNVTSHSMFAYVLVQNRRPIAQRNATEQSTYILRYERNSEGRYLPSQIRENDPLGSMRNVAHFDSLAADSITFVPASAFSSNTQADGAARVNLFHPGLTATDSILIRFENGQVTLIPYGQNRPAGSADACGYYGQNRMPSTSEAGVSMDAVVPDSGAQDAGRDSSMDARREGGTDAATDARRDGNTDVRDASIDRSDARSDASTDTTRTDASLDASRDAGRDGGVDAAADANRDAARDSGSDAPRG